MENEKKELTKEAYINMSYTAIKEGVGGNYGFFETGFMFGEKYADQQSSTLKHLHYTETTRADMLQEKLDEICKQLEASDKALNECMGEKEILKEIKIKQDQISHINDCLLSDKDSKILELKKALRLCETFIVAVCNEFDFQDKSIFLLIDKALKD